MLSHRISFMEHYNTYLIIGIVLTFNILFYIWSFYGLTSKRKRFAQLVNSIPGPRPLPFFGNALKFFGNPDFNLQRLAKLVAGYSTTPIRFWLGLQPYVILDDPKDIEIILNHPKCQNKDALYKILEPIIGQGLISGSGDYWRKHKKIIFPTFHISILDQFVDTFVEHSDILIEKLKPLVEEPKFNIMDYIHRCSLDLVCDTIMGTKINTQGGDNSAFYFCNQRLYNISFNRMFKLWLHPEWIFYNTPIGREFLKCLDVVNSFTDSVFQKKKKEYYELKESVSRGLVHDEGRKIKRRAVFLDLIMEVSEDGKLFSDEECKEELNTLLAAAVDTISTVSCFVILMLGIHQHYQKKVIEELDEIFGDSKFSPTPSDLQKMTYLDQVIKETLRIFPIGPIILRKIDEDVKISNYTLPAGVSTLIFLFNTQRRPELFPNPEKFDPERFTPENIEKRHPYSFIPYSAGPRKCIGQTYSMMAMKVLISTVLRNFKILADIKMEDVKIKGEISVHSVGGYNVRLKHRTHS